jgi:ribonuclease T2
MIKIFFRAIVGILFISLSLSLQAKTVLKEVGKFDYYVLALTWQPAFCELRTKKPECQSQHSKRFDAHHFVLHGLWPNVKGDKKHRYGYCEVSRKTIKKDKKRQWCRMPELDLSKNVRTQLTELMPGSASCLQRHEWYKHGSCSGLSENDYYALSNRLVEMFSKTQFSQKVAENVGKFVKRHELLKAFDKEFGKGSRNYLALKCKKVRGTSLLTELQIHLKKDIGSDNNFRNLFPKEKPKIWGSCPSRFKIDEVGIQ